jgi:hypothetical protein
VREYLQKPKPLEYFPGEQKTQERTLMAPAKRGYQKFVFMHSSQTSPTSPLLPGHSPLHTHLHTHHTLDLHIQHVHTHTRSLARASMLGRAVLDPVPATSRTVDQKPDLMKTQTCMFEMCSMCIRRIKEQAGQACQQFKT